MVNIKIVFGFQKSSYFSQIYLRYLNSVKFSCFDTILGNIDFSLISEWNLILTFLKPILVRSQPLEPLGLYWVRLRVESRRLDLKTYDSLCFGFGYFDLSFNDYKFSNQTSEFKPKWTCSKLRKIWMNYRRKMSLTLIIHFLML